MLYTGVGAMGLLKDTGEIHVQAILRSKGLVSCTILQMHLVTPMF